MSDHDEVMERLDWLVEAVKHLLSNTAIQNPILLTDGTVREVVRPPSDTPVEQPVEASSCSHQHQALIGGRITCAKCGMPLGPKTGVVGKDLRPEEATWLAKEGPQ